MRYLFTILSLCLALAAADEQEINALIDDVVNATPQTRYEKMNAFKLKMRELNQEQRKEALKALQEKAYPALDADRAPSAENGQDSGKQDAGTGIQQQLRMQQQQQQMLQQQEQQMQNQQQQKAR